MKRFKKKLRKSAILFLSLTILIASSFSYFYFTAKQIEAAWYQDSWGLRKKLTINHSKVSGSANISNFPVLVSLTDIDLKKAQSTGNDILFTDSDGTTKLDHEIEKFDNSTGTLRAWVRIPTLHYLTDDVIYLYYGNSSTTSQQNKTGVWGSSYTGVWHLAEKTGHQTNSTNTTGIDSISEVTTQQGSAEGIVNGSDEFGASDNVVKVADNANLRQDGDMTIETWVKMDTQGGRPVYKGTGAGPAWESYVIWLKGASDSNRAQFEWANTGGTVYSQSTNTSLQTGVWYHIVGVKSGTTLTMYLNGVSDNSGASPTTSGAINSASPIEFTIGNSPAANSPFDGVEDEVRYSNTAKTPAWIATTYNTISSPSTFFTANKTEEQKNAAIVRLSFDEGTGTTTHDSSPNRFDGSLSGTTKPTWQGKEMCVSEKCLYYNGTTAYTNIPSSVANVQSVSFWVKPKTNGETLMDFDGGTHYISATAGTITATGFSSPTIYVNGTASASLVAGSWQHITITTGTAFTASNITIGKRSASYLSGFLDEFRVYDYVRTAAQVKIDVVGKASVLGASSVGITSQGLMGYWKMDENTGTSITDTSGNGNNGSFGNTPTWGAGKYGSGVYLNTATTNKYITIPSTTNLDNLTQFTWSIWVNPAQLQGAKLIEKDGMQIYFENISSGLRTQVYIGCSTSSLDLFSTSADNLPLNVWHNITLVKDDLSCNLSSTHLYIDGVPIHPHVNSASGVGTRVFDAGVPIILGNTAAFNSQFLGFIDEFRVYNRALSPVEVNQLYALAPGPVGFWKMDENSGNTTEDSSGNVSTLTFANGPVWEGGTYGKAIHMNGTNSYLTTTTDQNLLDMRKGSFSLFTWIKSKKTAHDGMIFFKGAGNATDIGYDLSTSNSTGELQLDISNGTTYLLTYLTGTSDVSDGNWHYVGFTWNPSFGAKIYADGKLENTAAATSTVDLNSSDPLLVGGYSSSGYSVDGTLDNAIAYNYERTPGQIVEDMNMGHPAPGTPVGSAVGEWKFDEGYGDTVHDSGSAQTNGNMAGSGTVCPAASSSCPGWVNDGKFGKAMHFDGSNDYVDFGTNNMLSGASEGSICTWMRYTDTSVNGDGALISNYNNWTDGWIFWVDDVAAYNGNSNTVSFAPDPSGPQGRVEGSTNLVTPGVWDHYCGVFKGGQYIRLYKNGKLDSEQTKSVSSVFSTGSSYTTYMGRSMDGRYLNADLDEMKVYRYALTPSQVVTDYNKGKSMVLGSLSNTMKITGTPIPSNSSSAAYCVPGSSDVCSPPGGEWKFDEGRGTTAYDSSGNGNVATFGSNLPTWSAGKIGGGLNFNGSNSRVMTAVTSNLDLVANGTIETWIYPTGGDGTLVVRQDGPNWLSTGYELHYEQTNQRVDLWRSGESMYSNSNVITPNKWNHVVAVISSNVATIYINGTAQGSGNFTISANGSSEISIGANHGGVEPFVGKMDDVRIYSYARTPAQVAWDYNRGAPVVHYKFDECKGNLVHNSITNGMDGTIVPNAGRTTGSCGSGTSSELWNGGTNGKYGASLMFDGVQDYVTIADTLSLRPGNGSWTVSVWMKPQNVDQLNMFLNKTQLAGVGTNYTMGFATNTLYSAAAQRLVFTFTENSSSIYRSAYSNDDVIDGNWHMYTAVADKSSDRVRLFMDGVELATTHFESGVWPTITNTDALALGGVPSIPGSFFNGQIDDFRIYNYALTPEQIKTTMNQDFAIRFGP